MGLFTFILLLVLITTVGKAAVALLGPLADHAGDYLRETAAERKARRESLQTGGAVDPVLIEELETRLARIEDRLDFLEELRAPARRTSLSAGRAEDDGG
jgi:hypothetical protein